MGDLFGKAQSGETTFRIADLVRDEALNEIAREEAERVLARDPNLESQANAGLRATLGKRYSRALELFRVG